MFQLRIETCLLFETDKRVLSSASKHKLHVCDYFYTSLFISSLIDMLQGAIFLLQK